MTNKHPQKKHITIKVWYSTRRALKVISAITGRPMVEIADEIAEQKLREVKAAEVSPV